MKAEFVELELNGFSAIVPNLLVLPATEILPLMAGNAETMERFTYTAALLRKYISVELVDQYESMDLQDMVDFVSQWVQKSTPKSDGGE